MNLIVTNFEISQIVMITQPVTMDIGILKVNCIKIENGYQLFLKIVLYVPKFENFDFNKQTMRKRLQHQL